MKRYRTALVLGFGISGAAAARLLLRERTCVTVVDSAATASLRKTAAKLRSRGAKVLLGCVDLPSGPSFDRSRSVTASQDFDVCVVSPGIRSDSKWVKEAKKRGIEVVSELDLGASRCKCRLLAITGSKGKSTLVKLCGDVMRLAGKRAAVAGNYGIPLSDVALKSGRLDWIVVEVSSFQMEETRDFHPEVGCILNIQPDHLDRHGNMATYAAMKTRIFANMNRADFGVVLDRNVKLVKRTASGSNQWLTFGRTRNADFTYSPGKVKQAGCGKAGVLDLDGTMFDNEILGVALAATAAIMKAVRIAPKFIKIAARRFKPLPHRMNRVGEIRGVQFINDSKATSLTALCAGVEMCGGPVRLIAGGQLKEKNLELPQKVLARRVRKVYLIGESSRAMYGAWKRATECLLCGTLKKAIRRAFSDASAGETILLSPGCASFDQFMNFEDRGNKFAGLVGALKNEE